MHDRPWWTSSTGTLVSSVNNDTIAERRLVGSDTEADTSSWIFPRVFAYNPATTRIHRVQESVESPGVLLFPPFSLSSLLRATRFPFLWASSMQPPMLTLAPRPRPNNHGYRRNNFARRADRVADSQSNARPGHGDTITK